MRSSITNAAEARFAAEVEQAGKTWLWQPRAFRLPGDLGTYRPDFYVIEDRCFYEIVATRQAYSYARVKIRAFRRAYPHLPLHLVNAGAWANGPAQRPLVARPRRNGDAARGGRGLVRLVPRLSDDRQRELVATAERLGYHSLAEIAVRAGVGYTVLRRWMLARPTDAIGDKIEDVRRTITALGPIVKGGTRRVVVAAT